MNWYNWYCGYNVHVLHVCPQRIEQTIQCIYMYTCTFMYVVDEQKHQLSAGASYDTVSRVSVHTSQDLVAEVVVIELDTQSMTVL